MKRFFASIALISLTIAAQAGSAPRFGVNQDFVWTRDADIPWLIRSMTDAHVQAVRIAIRWNVVEPAHGKWDFTKVDSVVRALRDAKIEILPTLMGTPAWASGVVPGKVAGFYDVYPPQKMEDWAEFVREVVLRYRKEIHYWEIWNEENGVDFFRPAPDAGRYVALLKSAHDTIKHADPEAVVVIGGLQMNGIIPNPWSPVKVENFLQKIYDAGGRRYFDVVNIHPYVLAGKDEGPAYAATLVRATVEEMQRNKDGHKPLWITETGIATNDSVTEQMQAEHLTGIYRELGKIPQVKAIYWFLLQDMDRSVLGGENSMGLVSADGRRKAAFEALKQAAAPH